MKTTVELTQDQIAELTNLWYMNEFEETQRIFCPVDHELFKLVWELVFPKGVKND